MMSRSYRKSKGPGYEYWSSRLHRYGEIPGRYTKTLTHKKERRASNKLCRKAKDEVQE